MVVSKVEFATAMKQVNAAFAKKDKEMAELKEAIAELQVSTKPKKSAK